MNSGIFLIFNAILGLVVNILTLAGFVFGVVELQPGWGPLSKPGPVLLLLYVFMVIIWLLMAFLLLSRLKQRYGIGQTRGFSPTDEWKVTFGGMNYIMTVPSTLLWLLVWMQLFEDAGLNVWLFAIVGFFSLASGGMIVAKIVLRLDWLFNPTHYREPP